ncbi:IS110 family transposase [Burkholderia ubonensis]|uniref:IS110 family transposase n=1 Tax=Burkholderia ubonensis TaxID=101571 RepID=UPI001E38CAC8|nr:IS110 family transposase [Burkholderia ubonensis]
MEQHEVILGVDTHLDTHVGAVISETGKLLGTLSVSADTAGYLKLLTWTNSLGRLCRAGVEGAGTYGAGLARVLRDHEVEVLEVNRPDRAARRSRGKSDPTDAENAARAVLAGKATAIPKEQSGAAEAMRAVSVARRSAVKAKTQAINQLRALLVSAPQDIRERLLKTKTAECVANCARLRSLGDTPMLQTLATTLRLLAKRFLALAEELKTLDTMLERLTLQHARRLRERFGVGPQTAAVLVAVAGDNPERLKSEAALAALCGTSPLQASSGKTVRHRLNRGGDRAANNAFGPLPWCARAAIREHGHMSSAGPRRACRTRKFIAA